MPLYATHSVFLDIVAKMHGVDYADDDDDEGKAVAEAAASAVAAAEAEAAATIAAQHPEMQASDGLRIRVLPKNN